MYKDACTQSKFFQLRLQGKTLLEISEELEISLSTANRWNKFFKADIINTRNSEIESFRKKIAGRYSDFFEFLSGHFETLKSEIESAEDLKSVPYKDLLACMLKVLDAVNKMDVFKKFSDKSAPDNVPDDVIPETDYRQTHVSKKFAKSLEECA